MKVVLSVSELLLDIRNKSHEECQSIEDPEKRFKVEAGQHKDEELFRSLSECASRLARKVSVYLDDFVEVEAEASNEPGLPDTLVYDFDFSERRMIGKAQPLADAMHDYLVHYTLAKYYATVNLQEFSNTHSLLALDAGNEVDALIYSKKAPRP